MVRARLLDRCQARGQDLRDRQQDLRDVGLPEARGGDLHAQARTVLTARVALGRGAQDGFEGEFTAALRLVGARDRGDRALGGGEAAGDRHRCSSSR